MIELQTTDTQQATSALVDILFRGEIMQGYSADEVKQSIGKLFNLEPIRLDQLFAAESCYLKRHIDLSMVNKIQAAMVSVGAVADIQQHADCIGLTLAPVGVDVWDSSDDRAKAKAKFNPQQIDQQKVDAMVSQPLGSDILTETESPKTESLEIELSHLKLTEQ
jgi:hypothetical protein